MKKHNHAVLYGLLFLCVSVVFLYSCRTVPEANPVQPIELLGRNTSMYISIPVQEYKNLVKMILRNSIKNVSESDADKIIDHIDIFYAGIGAENDAGKFESVVTGSVPKSASHFLTEKNGWNEEKYTVTTNTGHEVTYRYYNSAENGIQTAFVSQNYLCIAPKVQPLMERYVNAAYNGISETEENNTLDADMEDWISQRTQGIRFCVLRPQAFLARLIGSDMRLALVNARGIFLKQDESENLTLTLYLTFEKPVVVNAAVTLLRMAAGNDITVVHEENSPDLEIGNIVVTQDKLVSLLSIKK